MRIADPRPFACSVCLQPPGIREPQPEFVDFEVAYEGPVLTRHNEEVRPENSVKVPVDDLFICEDCLRSAARLIGMEDGEAARKQIAALTDALVEKEKEIEAKDKALSHADFTVGYLIDAEKVSKRPMGKPQIHGPESHDADLKQLRKNRAAAENSKGANKKRSEAMKERQKV